MPRIRKKTSKRTNLHQRARIKHKAVETRKKRGKEAKKNVQWKTKHPKDPGIPANFPYKDQILAEIVEQRRQAAEEKEKRKEEKKAARAKAKAGPANESIVEDGAEPNGRGKVVEVSGEIDEDSEAPILLNPDYPNLQAILDRSDVVIHILDARDPLAFRSSHLEELVGTGPKRKILLVLNKIDTCPREVVISWAAYLRTQYPTFLFRSASSFLPGDLQPRNKGKEKESSSDALGVIPILSCLSQWVENKETKKPLVVAVTGVTNVGKSSFISSILQKPVCPIYKISSSSSQTPTTTIVPQEVSHELSGKTIHLIDTPGLSWRSPVTPTTEETHAEATRAQDILLRSRGRVDRLKDPIPPLNHIVSRANKQDLMVFYNLPAFVDNDPTAFLSGIARSNGLIKTGGNLDLNGAARIILRDWSTGKFPRYTVPSPTTSNSAVSTTDGSTTSRLYMKDETVLSQLKARNDMRKSTGIVRLVSGVINTRKIVLDANWTGVVNSDAEDDDEDVPGSDISMQNADIVDEERDEDEDEDDDEDEDGIDDDDGGDEEELDSSPAPPSKRKRPSGLSQPSTRSSRPTKKVAFDPQPRPTQTPRQLATTPLKSVLKTRPTTSIPNGGKKAEVTVSKKLKTGVHQPKDGEQAYDFSRFF